MTKLLILVGLAGCVQGYYVADVHPIDGGGLVMEKCAIDFYGKATRNCHEEVVGDDTSYDGTDYVGGAPDPAEIHRVQRQLAATAPAARPAPTDEAIAHALAATGVHRLVELCRNTYAKDVTAFDVALDVLPSGEIADVTHDAVADKFADCAVHAVRTANIAPFDGAPVHSAQRLVL